MELEHTSGGSGAVAPSQPFTRFEDLDLTERSVGGKAWALAALAQRGFPVPPGIILRQPPLSSDAQKEIFQWWQQAGGKALAVRSSYGAEDSGNLSFAGQNETFLDVTSEDALVEAINRCFVSFKRSASEAYRDHFHADTKGVGMNVVVQVMVEPAFSGVFFSENPLKEGWLLEYIEGLGEDLVSGNRTPHTVTASEAPSPASGWKPHYTDMVVTAGLKVKQELDYEVDMEWAIDGEGVFHLLQARPITTQKAGLDVPIIARELERLKEQNTPETTWDSKTFAEWTGIPSYLTFSLWKDAFSPDHAFGRVLSGLGYLSFDSPLCDDKRSVLQRVYGRAYVNLTKLNHLYFGPIPYKIKPKPRPHLAFDYKKITVRNLLLLPYLIWHMVSVSLKLTSGTREMLSQCRRALLKFKHGLSCPNNPSAYSEVSLDALHEKFCREVENFSTHTMYWPLKLVFLTESTIQSLSKLLSGVVGRDKVERLLAKWMSRGIHTVTYDMNQAFRHASAHPEERPFFLSGYGHRGPGELDLANPRWVEIGEKVFFSHEGLQERPVHKGADVASEIESLKTIKKPLILEEWQKLKRMLELREQWKMALLKPYAELRYMALELGRRYDLGEDIFWLRFSEIKDRGLQPQFKEFAAPKIRDRKTRFDAFARISLPESFTAAELTAYLGKEDEAPAGLMMGQGISAGAVQGTAVVITDIESIAVNEWPKDAIIVAEATDPGWTPLFAKARAVVVEKGGMLSHCAIVAREMGLPAVAGIHGCHRKIKSGMKIWVNGNQGRVSIDE